MRWQVRASMRAYQVYSAQLAYKMRPNQSFLARLWELVLHFPVYFSGFYTLQFGLSADTSTYQRHLFPGFFGQLTGGIPAAILHQIVDPIPARTGVMIPFKPIKRGLMF